MQRNGKLIQSKYNSLLVSTLAMTASMYLANILDGIMVGRILGTVQLSAINLTLCITFLENILIALFTFGGNTLCIMYKGKRDNDRANVVFTLTVFAGIISAILICIFGLIFVDQAAGLLSQDNAELKGYIKSYMVPLWLLTPLMAIVNQVAAFSRTDGMKKFSTMLPIVANVINLVCDLVYMKFFGMGIAGAGWATITGYAVGVILALSYFKSGSRTVFFTKEALSKWKDLGQIFLTGLPSSLIYVCNFLRLFFTNSIILSSTGTMGVQIASVTFSLNSLAFIFVEGSTMTLLAMLGALYGEKDLKGQKIALRHGFVVTMLMSLVIFVISELLPAFLASFYGLTDPDIISVFNTTFRITSINIPILAIIYVMRTFYQATGNKMIANIIVFLDGFAVVVPLMWAFSKIDIYWLWASFPVSKAITVILVTLIVIIYKLVKSKDNLLLVDGEEGEVLDFTIHNSMNAAEEASAKVKEFCENNGAGDDNALRLSIATEELCTNTVKYALKDKKDYIDVYVKISDKNIILKLRDCGDIFNPTEFKDDSGKEITGLELVRKITSDIEYNRVIGFNVSVVTVER